MKKIILITGCSQGLGKYLAQKLALEGHKVYAGVRKKEDIKNLEKEKNSTNIYFVKLDVTSASECKEIVDFILKKEKKIDVLINNAGNTLNGPVTNFSDKDFLNLLNVNTVGAFRLITAVIPSMKNSNGKIINITSLNGLLALPNFSIYCASKFALQALGDALYYELIREDIHVTSLAPGAISHPENRAKKMSHKPAREKFFLLKLFMPLLTYNEIYLTVKKIIKLKTPPRAITFGNDAKITFFLQRFLPSRIWESLMTYVWKK